MNEQVKIFLTPLDAELFKQFQRYHEMFVLMQKHKVFDIQYGKAQLNFLAGELQSVEVHNVYKV